MKAGFVVAAWRGKGTLYKGNATSGYYSTPGASCGLQAGIQKYGYALFFMTDSALAYLDSTGGVVFDQKGLMAGMGLQGSKIDKIAP